MSRVFGGCRCGTPTSPIIQKLIPFCWCSIWFALYLKCFEWFQTRCFFFVIRHHVFTSVSLFMHLYDVLSTEFSGNVSATLCLVLALFNDATWQKKIGKANVVLIPRRKKCISQQKRLQENVCRYGESVCVCQLHPPQAIRAQNKWRCSSSTEPTQRRWTTLQFAKGIFGRSQRL